ncbi:hypothetical protein R1sor_026580 [Riccia sorocarpa]|uniref:Uncharacterized protein n=1 Tax=Riccia sorocarpa TaxID=122646 RepID=A0ABD3GDH2_9MARC
MSKAKKPFDTEAQSGSPDLTFEELQELLDQSSCQTQPDIPVSIEELCFGQTQPDIPASKGGSQAEKRVKEDKGIKRKRTSAFWMKSDAQMQCS